MNTFRSTSRGRPSQQTIDARRSLERDYEEALAWGAFLAVYRAVAKKLDRAARADELREADKVE